MRDRQQKRKDTIYGRNWTPIMTMQAVAATGKRDHSSMFAAPISPSPRRGAGGMNGNAKRWTQQVITRYTGGNTNKPSKRQKNKNSNKIIIYETDMTSRANKRQRRNNEEQLQLNRSREKHIIQAEDRLLPINHARPSLMFSSEDGSQDWKVAARAVRFGGDKRFSCCRIYRFPFYALGRN